MARRFRFETEQEIKGAKNWAEIQGVPLGWGYEKDVLKLLGQEIVDTKLLEICERGGKLIIPSDTTIPTAYYVEIKEKEKMKRYRFKTKEEFGRDMPLGWVAQMLPNLGKELINITPDIEKVIINGGNFIYVGDSPGAYSYRYSDTVEIEEPKRIPKEDWEYLNLNSSICGLEMQNGNKFYLLWNVDGFIPVNLKEHSSNSYSDTSNIESGLDSMPETRGNKKLYKFETMEELIKWATT